MEVINIVNRPLVLIDVFTRGVSFFLSILVARYFSANLFSEFVLFMAYAQVLSLIVAAGSVTGYLPIYGRCESSGPKMYHQLVLCRLFFNYVVVAGLVFAVVNFVIVEYKYLLVYALGYSLFLVLLNVVSEDLKRLKKYVSSVAIRSILPSLFVASVILFSSEHLFFENLMLTSLFLAFGYLMIVFYNSTSVFRSLLSIKFASLLRQWGEYLGFFWVAFIIFVTSKLDIFILAAKLDLMTMSKINVLITASLIVNLYNQALWPKDQVEILSLDSFSERYDLLVDKIRSRFGLNLIISLCMICFSQLYYYLIFSDVFINGGVLLYYLILLIWAQCGLLPSFMMNASDNSRKLEVYIVPVYFSANFIFYQFISDSLTASGILAGFACILLLFNIIRLSILLILRRHANCDAGQI